MIIPKGTVVTIDGKVYRTLEAQVAWNKEELESLDIETLEELPGQFAELQENVSALSEHVDGVAGDVEENSETIAQILFDIEDIRGTISGMGIDLSSKQAKYLSTVVTIAPSDWVLDQTNGFRATKTVAGVTATNLVQVSPDASSIDDYSDNNIICDSQSANTLEFNARDVDGIPDMNIYVNVVIWG